MRNRARYKSFNRIITQITSSIGGGPEGLPLLYNDNGLYEYEAMVDTLTPGYFSRKGGVLPQNYLSYTCDRRYENRSVLTYWFHNNASYSRVSGAVCQSMYGTGSGRGGFTPLVPSIPGFNIDNLVAEAKASALAKVTSPEQAFREPIAQIVQTLRTITHPLKAIANIARRFSKKRRSARFRKKLKEDGRALADLWLSYSVNAGPNMATVCDAINAFDSWHNKRYSLKKDFAKVTYNSGNVIQTGLQTPSLGGLRKTVRSIEAEVVAGIIYTTDDSDSWGRKLGLRTQDLPGLVWELIPLSFMIDRMLNVKRFIDVSSGLMSSSLHIKGGFTTSRVLDKRVMTVHNLTVSGSKNPVPRDTPPYTTENFSFNRRNWVPVFSDAIPSFKPLGLVRDLHSTLDLVSLTLGRLTR